MGQSNTPETEMLHKELVALSGLIFNQMRRDLSVFSNPFWKLHLLDQSLNRLPLQKTVRPRSVGRGMMMPLPSDHKTLASRCGNFY